MSASDRRVSTSRAGRRRRRQRRGPSPPPPSVDSDWPRRGWRHVRDGQTTRSSPSRRRCRLWPIFGTVADLIAFTSLLCRVCLPPRPSPAAAVCSPSTPSSSTRAYLSYVRECPFSSPPSPSCCLWCRTGATGAGSSLAWSDVLTGPAGIQL